MEIGASNVSFCFDRMIQQSFVDMENMFDLLNQNQEVLLINYFSLR